MLNYIFFSVYSNFLNCANHAVICGDTIFIYLIIFREGWGIVAGSHNLFYNIRFMQPSVYWQTQFFLYKFSFVRLFVWNS